MAKKLAGGYTQKLLRVDLTNEKIDEEHLDTTLLSNYLGGTCLGIKYLYDEVSPHINWDDPRNIIFIGSGPIGGTRVPGSGAFSIVTKGAFNNGVASTQANGFLGAYLKFSGVDAILVSGTATNWKYIYCHDGIVEIKDAKHLVGKDTWDTENLIK
ncbi:MAG: aldehyde ferredoxin oxidoreductase, partial [Dehalococcoidia bacterium]